MSSVKRRADGRHLWSVAVPDLELASYLPWGVSGIATAYAGPTLKNLGAAAITDDVRSQLRASVRSLHEAGNVHGDLAFRNMAVLDGKALLIDLGNARLVSCEAELADLEVLLAPKNWSGPRRLLRRGSSRRTPKATISPSGSSVHPECLIIPGTAFQSACCEVSRHP